MNKLHKNFIILSTLLLYMFSNIFSTVNTYALEVESTETEEILDPSVYPDVIAEGAILMDAKTGYILYEKNIDEKYYPASVTKIMTALLALEKSENNLSDRVYFSEEAVFSLPPNSSHIAMNDGETLSLDDALYAVLLPSANEVSNAVAEYVSGSMEDFAKLMTQRAKELGCKNTNFINANGLHDDDHYTTARDIALIMKEAIKHPDFIRYISTYYHSIDSTEKQPEPKIMHNSNRLINPNDDYFYEYAIGGKTGYTTPAMHTLVSYAKKGDIELIAVTLKDQKSMIFDDSIKLFNYGFTQFEKSAVLKKSDFKKSAELMDNNQTWGKVNFGVEDSFYMQLPVSMDKSKLKFTDDLKTEYNKDIPLNEKIATLTVTYEDHKVYETDIIVESIEEIPLSQQTLNASDGLQKNSQDKTSSNIVLIYFAIIIAVIFMTFLIVKFVIKGAIKKKVSKMDNDKK